MRAATFSRAIRAPLFGAAVLIATSACSRLERFDNGDGSAYCGNVVGAEFVREGFATLPRMQLRLDMQSLDRFPGRITTDDAADGPCVPKATFENARLRVSSKLQADALSQLEFGEQRELNLIGWLDSSCDGTYLAVVSLLKNDDVEVRLMRSQAGEDAEEVGPFGVFRLTRHPTKCGF